MQRSEFRKQKSLGIRRLNLNEKSHTRNSKPKGTQVKFGGWGGGAGSCKLDVREATLEPIGKASARNADGRHASLPASVAGK